MKFMLKNYLDQFNLIIENVIVTTDKSESLSFDTAISLINKQLDAVKTQEKTIYLIGNGGSSGIVSHASVDLLNTCKLKAVALTDNSQLTCFANDYGYENVYAKPLETLLSTEDMLIALSSSGNSRNILNACRIAEKKETFTITLSGFSENNLLRQIGNINFWLKSGSYGMVEIGHALLLHVISDDYGGLINKI